MPTDTRRECLVACDRVRALALRSAWDRGSAVPLIEAMEDSRPMVANSGTIAPSAQHHHRPEVVVSWLVSTGIVLMCAVIMLRWTAGLSGAFLLGFAALGFLLAIPATIPILAALFLLCCAALATLAGDSKLAEVFGNLFYYCFALGYSWRIWEMVRSRIGLVLPLQHIWEQRDRQALFHVLPHVLGSLIAFTGAISMIVQYQIIVPFEMLFLVAALGIAVHARPVLALASALALVVLAGAARFAGEISLSVVLLLLASEASGMALLWLVWRRISHFFGWIAPWPAFPLPRSDHHLSPTSPTTGGAETGDTVDAP